MAAFARGHRILPHSRYRRLTSLYNTAARIYLVTAGMWLQLNWSWIIFVFVLCHTSSILPSSCPSQCRMYSPPFSFSPGLSFIKVFPWINPSTWKAETINVWRKKKKKKTRRSSVTPDGLVMATLIRLCKLFGWRRIIEKRKRFHGLSWIFHFNYPLWSECLKMIGQRSLGVQSSQGLSKVITWHLSSDTTENRSLYRLEMASWIPMMPQTWESKGAKLPVHSGTEGSMAITIDHSDARPTLGSQIVWSR